MKTSIEVATAVLLMLTATAAIGAELRFTTIALTGVDDHRGPGMGPGVTYSTVVNASSMLVPGSGQTDILFGGIISGGPYHGQNVRMRHDGANPSLLLATGAHISGLPTGVTIADIGSRPLATANGNIAQSVDIAGTGITTSNDEAWLVGNPASLNVIQKGTVAPGTGALFNQMDEGVETITTGGSTFTANLVGPGVTSSNDLATFYATDVGNVELIAREGAVVPGNPGLTYVSPGTGWLAGNSNYYFRTTLQGAGITSANDLHVLTWLPGGATTILAGNGLAVPGIAGATYTAELPSEQRTIGVVPDGSVLLGVAVTGGVFGAGSTNTILAGDASGLSNAIPLGAIVPGTTAQLIGGRLPMVGDSDTFAFMGDMSDGTTAIMVMNQGTLRRALPASAGSTVTFYVNALGDLVAPQGSQWVYAHRNGDVLPFLHTSQPFDVDSGFGTDLRMHTGVNSSSLTITSSIQQRRSGDGPVYFNELGQFLFGLQFEDGSRGIFLIAPVPEPTSFALVLLGAFALAALRRRR